MISGRALTRPRLLPNKLPTSIYKLPLYYIRICTNYLYIIHAHINYKLDFDVQQFELVTWSPFESTVLTVAINVAIS